MISHLYDLAKAEVHTAFDAGYIPSEQWIKQVSDLQDKGMTKAQAAAWGAMSSKSDSERFGWLADQNWSEDLKEQIFMATKGEDLTDKDGDISQYGRLALAKENGVGVSDYLKWLGESANKNTAEKYNAFMRMDYPDDVKEAMLPFINTKASDSGIEKVINEWQYVKNRGVDIDTYVKWKSMYAAMPSDSQENALRTLKKSVFSDAEKIAITGTLFENRNTLTADGKPTAYAEFLEMINDGVKINDYLDVKAENAIPEYRKAVKAGLKPDYAVNAALKSHAVKAKVIEARAEKGLDSGDWVDYCIEALNIKDSKERLPVIASLMNESDWEKCTACRELVQPEYYVIMQYEWKKLKEQYPDMTMKQDYVALAIDKMNCPVEQKAVLFQMMNKGWTSSKNNPYSSAAGDRALQAMQVGKYKPEVDEGELRLPVIE